MFGKKKASPAAAALQLFTRQLDSENIKYSVDSEKDIVRVRYNGDHFKSVTFTFIFDDDGESFALRVFSISQFTNNQLNDAYEFCNRMNYKYRWLRFYIDSDDELTAAIDAVITPSTAGAECFELLARTVNIVDDVLGEA